jgi:hypothetical protein
MRYVSNSLISTTLPIPLPMDHFSVLVETNYSSSMTPKLDLKHSELGEGLQAREATNGVPLQPFHFLRIP